MDALFRKAVSAIDAGDVAALGQLLKEHPELLRERLESPGDWLRKQVDGALEGYFQRPYLLWFVAENPLRNETLPANIAEVAGVIIEAARGDVVPSLQEQLDYTLGLVVTGRVPRECGVQRALIDVLIDAGARPGSGNGALGARNLEGVEQLIARGAPLTLATALCLGRFDEAARLAPLANADHRQTALVAAAFNGMPEAVRMLLALGVDVNAHSSVIHPHATPLHHAVDSGSLEAVKLLVEAGARLDTRDHIYDGTPLDWAEYLGRTEIAAWLRQQEGQP
jgi:peptide-methionine (S)-S-oxide reductase